MLSHGYVRVKFIGLAAGRANATIRISAKPLGSRRCQGPAVGPNQLRVEARSCPPKPSHPACTPVKLGPPCLHGSRRRREAAGGSSPPLAFHPPCPVAASWWLGTFRPSVRTHLVHPMLRARRSGSPRGATGQADCMSCPRGGASPRTTRPPQSAWRGMPVCGPCVLALNHSGLCATRAGPLQTTCFGVTKPGLRDQGPALSHSITAFPQPARFADQRVVRGERHDLSSAHTVSVVGPTALCVGGDFCRCRPSRAGRLHRRLSRKASSPTAVVRRAQAAASLHPRDRGELLE